MKTLAGVALVVLMACGSACGSDGTSSESATGGPAADGGGGGSDGGGSNPSRDGAPDSPSSGDSGGVTDPASDGPVPFAEMDATTKVTATGHDVALHIAHPTAAGKYPVVVFGHGFQLPPSQYYGYLKRLASFGYVAITVDYPAAISGSNNPDQAADMIAAIDWAKADSALGAKVDTSVVGMSGHSLGGKVALLAATMDARVKASIVLDPVDAGGPSGCMAPACVNVASLLPTLKIPTAFLGETTDATGTFQACAPAASNFTTFYAKASSPSIEVTVTGANHMSFLDDVSTCGLTCSFCKAATEKNARVTELARAYVVAFYERHLRGRAAYDAYLTGADAKARYVTTNRASIAFK